MLKRYHGERLGWCDAELEILGDRLSADGAGVEVFAGLTVEENGGMAVTARARPQVHN